MFKRFYSIFKFLKMKHNNPTRDPVMVKIKSLLVVALLLLLCALYALAKAYYYYYSQ
jgi:hypothetical protein